MPPARASTPQPTGVATTLGRWSGSASKCSSRSLPARRRSTTARATSSSGAIVATCRIPHALRRHLLTGPGRTARPERIRLRITRLHAKLTAGGQKTCLRFLRAGPVHPRTPAPPTTFRLRRPPEAACRAHGPPGRMHDGCHRGSGSLPARRFSAPLPLDAVSLCDPGCRAYGRLISGSARHNLPWRATGRTRGGWNVSRPARWSRAYPSKPYMVALDSSTPLGPPWRTDLDERAGVGYLGSLEGSMGVLREPDADCRGQVAGAKAAGRFGRFGDSRL